MSESTAMLFALSTPHPSVTLDNFNEWYDTRHAPSRAACPGVQSVSRFVVDDTAVSKAAEVFGTDYGQSPGSWTWLAMYELNSEDALKTAEYRRAREEDGDDESRMFDFLSRRVYKLLSNQTRRGYADFAASGKIRSIMVVALEPDVATGLSAQEFNDWYEQEHVAMLSRCPGWLRSSRWELLDARDPRTWEEQAGIARYLALHEWEDADAVLASPELEAAMATPWRESTVKRTDQRTREMRLLKLWKQF